MKPELPTFTAIDFETADVGRDSACAVGLVRVERGKIAEKVMRLIRPPRQWFVYDYLHGITWERVKGEPRFKEVWRDVAHLLKGVEFVAAHYARFDRSVLEECCASARLSPPRVKWLCTRDLAKRTWGLSSNKLDAVCAHLGIPLRHHNALSDAMACARIVLRAWKEAQQ